MKRATSLLLTVLLLAACESTTTGPEVAVSREARVADPGALRVMTRNVYVGAPIESVTEASSPAEIPFLVAEVWAQVRATNFPERAEALAEEIRRERPHLVGLQEVSLFRTQSPGDFLAGNPTAAETTALDFLGILLDALTARGLDYVVGARATNFDLEVPMATPQGLVDIRITDFDVILARSDVELGETGSRSFEVNATFELGGSPIEVLRGWAWADAAVNGRMYRFVNTHLEPADMEDPARADGCPKRSAHPLLHQVQLAQAGELLAWLGGTSLPVVMVGDFNSAASGCTTDTYRIVLEAGFTDAWTASGARDRGFTASQDLDLRNRTSKLFHRIDFVFYRGLERGPEGVVAVSARRVGARPADRTPSGLWPSDHAGVSAVLRAAPGRFGG